jgi:hypothetical protein
MLRGIPYFGEDNIRIKSDILSEPVVKTLDTDLFSLVKDLKPKTYVVIVEDKYLTWLDDIEFNYKHGICSIPYISFRYGALMESHRRKKNPHLDYNEDGDILVRCDFIYNKKTLNIGVTMYPSTDFVAFPTHTARNVMACHFLLSFLTVSNHKPSPAEKGDRLRWMRRALFSLSIPRDSGSLCLFLACGR